MLKSIYDSVRVVYVRKEDFLYIFRYYFPDGKTACAFFRTSNEETRIPAIRQSLKDIDIKNYTSIKIIRS